MAETLLTLRKVQERTTHSKTETYRRIATGEHPKPVPIGPGRVAWIESEIDAYVERLIAQRRENAA